MKQIQPGRARAPRLYENQEGNAGGHLRMQQAMRKTERKKRTAGSSPETEKHFLVFFGASITAFG